MELSPALDYNDRGSSSLGYKVKMQEFLPQQMPATLTAGQQKVTFVLPQSKIIPSKCRMRIQFSAAAGTGVNFINTATFNVIVDRQLKSDGDNLVDLQNEVNGYQRAVVLPCTPESKFRTNPRMPPLSSTAVLAADGSFGGMYPGEPHYMYPTADVGVAVADPALVGGGAAAVAANGLLPFQHSGATIDACIKTGSSNIPQLFHCGGNASVLVANYIDDWSNAYGTLLSSDRVIPLGKNCTYVITLNTNAMVFGNTAAITTPATLNTAFSTTAAAAPTVITINSISLQLATVDESPELLSALASAPKMSCPFIQGQTVSAGAAASWSVQTILAPETFGKKVRSIHNVLTYIPTSVKNVQNNSATTASGMITVRSQLGSNYDTPSVLSSVDDSMFLYQSKNMEGSALADKVSFTAYPVYVSNFVDRPLCQAFSPAYMHDEQGVEISNTSNCILSGSQDAVARQLTQFVIYDRVLQLFPDGARWVY